MFRLILIVTCVAGITACAPPKMYNWGNYEQGLYNSYKDPNQTEALRLSLEEQVVTVEASGQKMPPGIYAELGTLYLQATLMTALIANMDRQSSSKAQGKGKK